MPYTLEMESSCMAIDVITAVQSTKYLGWTILSLDSADVPLQNRIAYATE